MNYPRIVLKSGKDRSLRRFHPWVFSGAIKSQPSQLVEGEIVEVYDNSGEYLATGHYAIGSITVRLFSFQQAEITDEFWQMKVGKALDTRRKLGFFERNDLNVFRLMHGEADGLPGLIVDWYNGVAVLQAHSVGMYRVRESIALALRSLLGEKLVAIFDKSESSLPYKADVPHENTFLLGSQQEVEVNEYGSKFLVNVVEGQKTGFFIDQRENRKTVGDLSNGKKVLNLFSYSGGFSIAALRGGGLKVDSVDSSEKAMVLTDRNVEINGFGPDTHTSYAMDVFDFLEKNEEQYDIVVVDPPAFAKHIKVLDNGLKGYLKVNQRALKALKPGGLLFTFSCSQVVTKDDFRKVVFSALAMSGREAKIWQQVTQPQDHPISIYHPEGEYLKGLLLEVL
jgi:23S rRNA (cytosine1962-C5)-methyltransferase